MAIETGISGGGGDDDSDGGGGSSGGGSSSTDTSDAPSGTRRAIENPIEGGGGGSGGGSGGTSGGGGGDGGGEPTPPSGAQRAIEQGEEQSTGGTRDGGDSGPTPPSGTRRAIEQAPEPSDPRNISFGRAQQSGIESGETPSGNRVTSDLARQARDFERRLIQQENTIESSEDVNIRFRGNRLVAERTGPGLRRFAAIQYERFANMRPPRGAERAIRRSPGVQVSLPSGARRAVDRAPDAAQPELGGGPFGIGTNERLADIESSPDVFGGDFGDTSPATVSTGETVDATQQAREGALDYFRGQREQAETGISPSAAMTVREGDTERAERLAAGEQRIFELAEEGNLAARTYTGGEIIQNIGGDVRAGVEYLSPLDRVPVVGGGVERGIGGIAEGAFLLAGQIPQAASAPLIPGQSQSPSELAGETVEGTQAGAENVARFAQERPIEAATLVAFPYAVRGGTRAVRRGRSGTRNAETIDYADLTSERGARGQIPEFQEARAGEPTSRAVREVSERAADQPETLTRATESESAVFHTSGERLGSELRVGEGRSELPGLFTSPDVNPVGLRSTQLGDTGSVATSLRPTRPRLSSDRIAMFRDPEIAGMPESARGAGYEVRVGGERTAGGLGRGEAKSLAEGVEGAEVRPDVTTRGYRFLAEEADPGTAYVRPRGSRTPELEAIYPPESAFVESGSAPPLAARIGGREVSVPFTDRSFTVGGERVPIDVYSRAETRRVGEARVGEATAGEIGRTYTPTSEISARRVGTPSEAYLSGLGTSARAGTSSESVSDGSPETGPILVENFPDSGEGSTSSVGGSEPTSTTPTPGSTPTTSITPRPEREPDPERVPDTPTPYTPPPDTPTPDTPIPETPPPPSITTPEPDPEPRPRLGISGDADEGRREDELGFEAAPIYTDFFNPLTGERIQTERDGGMFGGWL